MEIRFSCKVLSSLFEGPLPFPRELAASLTAHSFEVTGVEEEKDDSYITLDILPNRAHDCLGYYFLAKEISVLTGKKLKPLPYEKRAGAGDEVSAPAIAVSAPECRRYTARRINSVSVRESPAWLRDTLALMGQKSINNVVDATNYCLWILNQPLHAFDAKKVVDSAISVRFAKKGEEILTLDGKKIVLDPTMLTVSDKEGPLAIAGIKGGKRAEVTEKTADIVLEAANFDPVSVRKTSRKIGMRTDSSRRFEHEITPELAGAGMDFATDLVLKVAGTHQTRISEIVDVYERKEQPRSITLSLEKVNRLLGTALSDEDGREILGKLGFEFGAEKDGYRVRIPSERLDIQIAADLIEEIGRVWGYDRIKSAPLSQSKQESKEEKPYYCRAKMENILTDLGFSQIETYSLAPAGGIEIENPPAEDKKFLRNNLKEGLSLALGHNVYYGDLLGLPQIKIFEIGTVFRKSGEEIMLALGIRNTKLYRGNEKESADLKNALVLLAEKLHISKEGLASLAKTDESGNGAIAEIGFGELTALFSEPASYKDVLPTKSHAVRFVPPSPFPFISRDIALFVPEETAKESIEKSIVEEGGFLLVQRTLFDVFKKDGKTSYAYRLVFQATDRTLTDAEVNEIMKRIVARLEGNPGWQAR